MIEREVKRLLSKEKYDELSGRLGELHNICNYYFACDDDKSLRIRQTDFGDYELTLKSYIGNNRLIREEDTIPLCKEDALSYLRNGIPESIQRRLSNSDCRIKPDYAGAMNTVRGSFTYKGLTFTLDRCFYLGKVDYEIECESNEPLGRIEDALSELGVTGESISKKERFFKALINFHCGNLGTIIFDLDGTLANTSEGVLHCFTATFEKFNVNVGQIDLNSCIGPPVSHTIDKYIEDEETRTSAKKFFQETYISSNASHKCRLYDGIKALLQKLRDNGKRLGVVTGKKECHARDVLEYLGIAGYFDFICGSDPDNGILDKADIFIKAETDHSIVKSDVVVIGDSVYDSRMCERCGLNFVGVLYGFGTFETMIEHTHFCFAENIDDLEIILFVCPTYQSVINFRSK